MVLSTYSQLDSGRANMNISDEMTDILSYDTPQGLSQKLDSRRRGSYDVGSVK